MIFRRSAKAAAGEPGPDAAEATPDAPAPTDPATDGTEVLPAPEPAAEGEGTEVLPTPDADGASEPSATEPVAEPDADATAVRDPDATTVSPAAEVDAEPTPDPDPDATAVREDGAIVTVDEDGVQDPAPPAKRKRGRKVLLGVGIALVVLVGGYAGAAWYFGDKVPQDTSVAGVDLSGMTATEAQDELTGQLAGALTEPFQISMGERTTTVDPAAAGLELDAAATVDAFTGFTLDPRVVFGHIFGLGERAPVVLVDEDALTTSLTAAATELDVAPVDGAIQFSEGAASVVTEPADGLALDVEAAAAELPDEWLTAQQPFELPSEVTEPTLGDDAVDAAMSDIVEPLLSGPVTVQLNDATTEISPEQLAAAATLQPSTSGFELVLDGANLASLVTAAVPSIGETPQDAQIILQDGAPTIVPAITGTGLDPDQLATVVSAAAVAAAPEGRVAVAELAQTEPEFSTADAEALGVTQIVSEFSTPYPYDPTRTQNLINGAANISNELILPGEQFSLIEALGPITTANGYVSSHVVENGFVTDAMGGGLSQISTTTFNAAFEAGMEDIQHKPHSRWFDRYPAGREATMYAPTLDMQWGNNTPYGVLVQAWVGDGRVHVRLWSTPYWTVDITSSNKYNYTSPQTVYNDDPDCSPESAGPSGFSIDINRTVALNGVTNDEFSRSYSWTYSPWNRVVCGDPPAPGDG